MEQDFRFKTHLLAAVISGLIVGFLCFEAASESREAGSLGTLCFTVLGACLGGGFAYVNVEFAQTRNLGTVGLVFNQLIALAVSSALGVFLTSYFLAANAMAG